LAADPSSAANRSTSGRRAADRVLMRRRSIHPRLGLTLPAGYLELNEAPCAGGAREAQLTGDFTTRTAPATDPSAPQRE